MYPDNPPPYSALFGNHTPNQQHPQPQPQPPSSLQYGGKPQNPRPQYAHPSQPAAGYYAQQPYQGSQGQLFRPDRVYCIALHHMFYRIMSVHDQTQEMIRQYSGELSTAFGDTSRELSKRSNPNYAAFTYSNTNLFGSGYRLTAGAENGPLVAETKFRFSFRSTVDFSFPPGSPYGGQQIDMASVGMTATKEEFTVNGIRYCWRLSRSFTSVKSSLFMSTPAGEVEVARFRTNSMSARGATFVMDSSRVDPVLVVLSACTLMWKLLMRKSRSN